MIGQRNLQERINKQLQEGTFPRFIILQGLKGSGKTTLALEIAKHLCYYPTLLPDVKMGTITDIIKESYKVLDTHVYILPDCDMMSVNAKNSLLKVVEEPPNNAYWIMTVENIDNVLPTIRSRGSVYSMEPYSISELEEYCDLRGYTNAEYLMLICDTPGEIDLLASYDIDAFIDYVELVVDNIAEVAGANAFKIGSKISLKKESDGYDLSLFWKAFRKQCLDRLDESTDRYMRGIEVTNRYANQLYIKGLNLSSLFDMWVLDIRKEWMD